MITPYTEKTEIELLEEDLLQEGFNLADPRFQDQLNRTRLAARHKTEFNSIEVSQSFKIAKAIAIVARNIVAIIFNFILVVLGMPISIVLLFIAEFTAVSIGIKTFFSETLSGSNIYAADLLAITTVVVYFCLVWYRATLSRTIQHRDKYKISLGFIGKSIGYFLGRTTQDGVAWAPELKEENDLNKVDKSISVLVWLIVILGVLGRLDTQIASYDNYTWYESVIEIISQSSLMEILELVGGALISFALLVATHFVLHYINDVYTKAVGVEEVNFFDPSVSLAAEQEAEALLLRHKLQQIRQKKAAVQN